MDNPLFISSLTRRRVVIGSLAAATAPFAGAQGSGQVPVKLIVPFTPGTGVDHIARQIAPQLAERLKRPFFVENKVGASGIIGTQEVVRATPDGSTLLVTGITLVMSAPLYPKLGFDPVKDLAPVTLTSWGQLLLVTHFATKIDSLEALIARAKAKPGELNYGSPGAGTPHHLAMELLKNSAKLSITHISYRGAAPAITDLLGGQIDLMFLPLHVALQYVKAGKLKALAIGSDKPNPLLPDVPPLNSLNVGNLNVDIWYGLFAPAGTPKLVIDSLNKETHEILAQPNVAAAFETQGMTPARSTPEEFKQIVTSDAKRWAELIQAQGIKAE